MLQTTVIMPYYSVVILWILLLLSWFDNNTCHANDARLITTTSLIRKQNQYTKASQRYLNVDDGEDDEEEQDLVLMNRTMIQFIDDVNHNYNQYPIQILLSSTEAMKIIQQQAQQKEETSTSPSNYNNNNDYNRIQFNLMYLPKEMKTLCDDVPLMNINDWSMYMNQIGNELLNDNNIDINMNDDLFLSLGLLLNHHNNDEQQQHGSSSNVCSYNDMILNVLKLNMNLPFLNMIKYVILPISYLDYNNTNIMMMKNNNTINNSSNSTTNATDTNHNMTNDDPSIIKVQFHMNHNNHSMNSYMDDVLTFIFMSSENMDHINQTLNDIVSMSSSSDNDDNMKPNPYLFELGNAQWHLRYTIFLNNNINATSLYNNNNNNDYDDYSNHHNNNTTNPFFNTNTNNDNSSSSNNNNKSNFFNSWFGLLNLLFILFIMTCLLRSYCIHRHRLSELQIQEALEYRNQIIYEQDINHLIISSMANNANNGDGTNNDNNNNNNDPEIYALSLDEFNQLPIIQYQIPIENHYNYNNNSNNNHDSTTIKYHQIDSNDNIINENLGSDDNNNNNTNNMILLSGTTSNSTTGYDNVDDDDNKDNDNTNNTNDDVICVPISSHINEHSAIVTNTTQENRLEDGDRDDVTNGQTASTTRISLSLTESNNDVPSTIVPLLLSSSCTSCSICLDDFILNEDLVILPHCKHSYHKDCIKQWILDKHSILCPLCKTDVLTIEQKEKKKKQYIQHRIQIQQIRRQLLLQQYTNIQQHEQQQQQQVLHTTGIVGVIGRRRQRQQRQIEMRTMNNPLFIVVGSNSGGGGGGGGDHDNTNNNATSIPTTIPTIPIMSPSSSRFDTLNHIDNNNSTTSTEVNATIAINGTHINSTTTTINTGTT